MNHLRPKNLNLFTIYFPIPAVVSFLHRVSGAFLFLLIPFLLWVLEFSLTDHGFALLTRRLDTFYFKFILWLLLIPYLFHLVAGIRHLLSDIHIGDTLPLGRITAWATFVVTIVLTILVGIWLW